MRVAFLVPPLLLLATACAGGKGERVTQHTPPPTVGWRALIDEGDRVRLRGWRDGLVLALARIDAAGARDRVAAQGALLQPDSALPDATPPAGAYRCRMTKLGTAGSRALLAYPQFNCRIAAGPGGTLQLAKLDGSQRPVGSLYPDNPERMVFLGSMVLGDERRALDYGRDRERDMVGALERIGPRRWRLLLPAPRWESLFDVMELVPG